MGMANMTGLLNDFDVLIYQNTTQDYIIAGAVFIGIVVLMNLFKVYILHRIRKYAEKTQTHIDDAVVEFADQFGMLFFIVFGLFVAAFIIELPIFLRHVVIYLFSFTTLYYVIKGSFKVVDFYINKKIEYKNQNEQREGTSLLRVMSSIIKISIFIIALMLVFSNMGFNVSSLLAGAGIAGIAIAFAVQNILGDLFSSFTIYFDKPFREGDFIIIGQDMGVVEHIGLKSTRIKTLQGQELVVSNQELTSTRVNNYKKMQKRRAVFHFGIEYGTPRTKLKKVPAIVRKIIKEIKIAELDRVHFYKFGDSSLDFEVVYYVDTSEYNKYMDVQQQINIKLYEAFDDYGISFAFPTTTMYMREE